MSPLTYFISYWSIYLGAWQNSPWLQLSDMSIKAIDRWSTSVFKTSHHHLFSLQALFDDGHCLIEVTTYKRWKLQRLTL